MRVGCFERTASKHVYYLGWNRSLAPVGCMRQALGPGALGKPRGSGWRGRWEGGSRWGTHVNPWLFHFNVWQNPLQIKKKKNRVRGTSLVEWIGICLPVWGTWVRSLVQEDSTCRRATKLVQHNYWAPAPQQRSRSAATAEARAPRSWAQ